MTITSTPFPVPVLPTDRIGTFRVAFNQLLAAVRGAGTDPGAALRFFSDFEVDDFGVGTIGQYSGLTVITSGGGTTFGPSADIGTSTPGNSFYGVISTFGTGAPAANSAVAISSLPFICAADPAVAGGGALCVETRVDFRVALPVGNGVDPNYSAFCGVYTNGLSGAVAKLNAYNIGAAANAIELVYDSANRTNWRAHSIGATTATEVNAYDFPGSLPTGWHTVSLIFSAPDGGGNVSITPIVDGVSGPTMTGAGPIAGPVVIAFGTATRAAPTGQAGMACDFMQLTNTLDPNVTRT